MRIAARAKRLTVAMLPALALVCALSVAAATAHGDGHGRSWHEGFRDNRAVIKGTITNVGTGSFGASAYVVTPGAGNASAAPTATAVTIKVASTTKVVTAGKSGLAVGDTFYALYRDVSDSTPLSTLAGDTPRAVYAFVAPAPQVEVKGVVTAAPTNGSDSFTATTFVVAQRQSAPMGGGRHDSRGGDHSDARRGHDLPGSAPATAGTPNTAITTDANTKITLNGQSSSVSNVAVGDMFVAIYNGTPSQALSTITATPALTVRAWTAPAGDSLYAFVGTVSGTASGGVTVNVTSSFPTGLFSGADSFSVGSQTKVLGNTKLATGDVVAGGLIAASGESATTVESSPLQVLVDFAPSTASSSSTTATGDQLKRAERRALEMLRREQLRMDRHHDKHGTHRK